MGQLSAARQALESAGVAPGDTLNALRNPVRRRAAPREPPSPEMMTMNPIRPFDLDDDTFCSNLRSCTRAVRHDLRTLATIVGV